MDDIVRNLLDCCEASEIEIEARIKKQLITTESVNRLLGDSSIRWNDVIVYAERKTISKTNRKCTYRRRQGVDGQDVEAGSNDVTVCKSSIAKEDVNDMWCTVHVSIETPVPSMVQILRSVAPTMVRRHRGVLEDHYVDVIHTPNSLYQNAHLGTDAEVRVEIEVCDPTAYDGEATMRVVYKVCTILQNAKQRDFLGFYDWKMVMHVANTHYGPFCIERGHYQKPRTMTINVLLGIIKSIDVSAVTPKVDGVRKFIIIANNRVFSLGTTKNVMHEGTMSINTKDVKSNVLPKSSGFFGVTVLDTEYIEDTDVYYVFDIAVYEDRYVGHVDFEKRMDMIENIVDYWNTGSEVRIKPYEKFDSFDRLKKLYESFSMKYCMDGLIFVDTSQDYIKPVFKWKAKITVDLEVSEKLGTCDGQTVDLNVSNVSILEPGIWEFAYDAASNELIAVKPRHDKLQGNSLNIVMTNLFYSVPGTMFSGKGFYLMRKYHNRVKKQLLLQAKDKNATIMDIGTGQGGDVGKWKRASSVLCVEPSEKAFLEMHERYRDTDLGSLEVTLLNCRLQDVDISTSITKKITIFTLFFCMNMFEPEDWRKLEEVVIQKGSKECRLLAIAMTDPKAHDSECFTIKKKDNNKYNVSIHDTRIIDIDEVSVDPKFFTETMKRCGMRLVKQQALDGYTFMTIDEKKLSSMYTMFVYEKT